MFYVLKMCFNFFKHCLLTIVKLPDFLFSGVALESAFYIEVSAEIAMIQDMLNSIISRKKVLDKLSSVH